MSWSLGEVKSLAIKAARGGGYPWGIAEDAGYAVEMLQKNGLAGAAALADLLEEREAEDGCLSCNCHTENRLEKINCPLRLGAYLKDLGTLDRMAVEIYQPWLLAPFLDRHSANATKLTSNGLEITVGNGKIAIEIAANFPKSGLISAKIAQGPLPISDVSHHTRVPADQFDAISKLEIFAHRTYAPSTEQSRVAGAGAGLTEND
ncbi:MAG: DUF3726 domain-containing protein [Pseudomonadota bacterium]